MKTKGNHFAKNINSKNITPPQQGRFVNKTSGFTIIEVALVLAIAGLIFLVVFLALPALQNSQKDTAKRQAVGQAIAAMETLEADNGGRLTSVVSPVTGAPDYPSTWNSATAYIGKLPANLSVTQNTFIAPTLPTANGMEVMFGAICGTDTTSSATGGTLFSLTTNSSTGKTVDRTTSVAVAVKLSSGSYYCKDI